MGINADGGGQHWGAPRFSTRCYESTAPGVLVQRKFSGEFERFGLPE